MGVFVSLVDLSVFADIPPAKAEALIADAEALAFTAAPCLVDPDDPTSPNPALSAVHVALVRAVVRNAVLRWHEAGVGVTVQQTAGPFSQTVDASRLHPGRLWPSELDQLKGICAAVSGVQSGGAFAVGIGGGRVLHAPWCNLHFVGGVTCSCGVSLTGYFPIYEPLDDGGAP